MDDVDVDGNCCCNKKKCNDEGLLDIVFELGFDIDDEFFRSGYFSYFYDFVEELDGRR